MSLQILKKIVEAVDKEKVHNNPKWSKWLENLSTQKPSIQMRTESVFELKQKSWRPQRVSLKQKRTFCGTAPEMSG
jgi:hypothetical protein